MGLGGAHIHSSSSKIFSLASLSQKAFLNGFTNHFPESGYLTTSETGLMDNEIPSPNKPGL